MCVGCKMSAHIVFWASEVWLRVETDRSVGLIRAENFSRINSTHYDVFKIFRCTGGWLRSGEKKGKWKENVDRVLLYGGDCRARWKIVIGGKSHICSFLLYSWIAASHMSASRSDSVWQRGGKSSVGFQQRDFVMWRPGETVDSFCVVCFVWVTGLKWKGTGGAVTPWDGWLSQSCGLMEWI